MKGIYSENYKALIQEIEEDKQMQRLFNDNGLEELTL